MTPDQFFIKYNGKSIDFDGVYGAQCFDVYRQYCKEVLGIPQSPATGSLGAKEIWNTYLKEYLYAIPNLPTNSPQLGDIIIWGSAIGQYGHVAICQSGGVMSFTSFDQNWNNVQRCMFVKHSYKGVLGWLRKKPVLVQDTLPPQPVNNVPVASPEPLQTPIIENPTTTTSETPTVTVTVTPPPDITPVSELPTTPDVVPVEIPKSSFIQVLLDLFFSILKRWTKSKK